VKGHIPDLSDIADLMWIENALEGKSLDPAKRTALVRAKQLLTGTNLTLRQIAGECGYADLPYFGVLFRKLTGTTPAAYRNQWCTVRATGT